MPADQNTNEKLKRFLDSHAIAALSVISKDDMPYSATVYTVVDEKLNFYFMSRNNSKKTENIEKNNKAALTIFDQDNPITVQVQGHIERVENHESITNLFVKIAESNAHEKAGFHWPPPISRIDNHEDISVYKITPTWLRMGDFSGASNVLEKPEEIFAQIIP